MKKMFSRFAVVGSILGLTFFGYHSNASVAKSNNAVAQVACVHEVCVEWDEGRNW